VRLGIKEGKMYRLLGQPVVGFRRSLALSSRESLEFGSVSVREHEALLSRPTWYEMTLMEEEPKYPDQSSIAVVAGSSSSNKACSVGIFTNTERGGESVLNNFYHF
jgi:hypothetical protein